MPRTRSIVLSLLAAVAVSAVGSAPASAQTRVYENCWLVGAGLGGFTTSQCSSEELGGERARTYFAPGGEFFWCHYVGLGGGAFNDANCVQGGGVAAFSLLRRSGLVVLMSGGTYTLKTKIAGASLTITCKKIKAKNPLITGGEPGRLEAEALEYTECVSTAPTKCVVNSLGAPAGTIKTEPLDMELVENTAKTEIEGLILPKGKQFFDILYSNKGAEVCALKGNDFPIDGSTLTLIDPQKTESEDQALLTEPASKEYINSKGETKTAELDFGKELFTQEGTATVLVDIEGKREPFGSISTVMVHVG